MSKKIIFLNLNRSVYEILNLQISLIMKQLIWQLVVKAWIFMTWTKKLTVSRQKGFIFNQINKVS